MFAALPTVLGISLGVVLAAIGVVLVISGVLVLGKGHPNRVDIGMGLIVVGIGQGLVGLLIEAVTP